MQAGIFHSKRMIETELRLIIIFLLTSSTILVHATAGRCYLCSQTTLAECAGTVQADSNVFNAVLQYYTEPCNGQCILFRNERGATIRGCSWTYGHMTSKSTGWHELSPGIQAYFCDSYLCNNGTFEQPVTSMIRTGILNEEISLTPSPTFNPQQVLIMSGHTPSIVQTNQELPPFIDISRQLRQCYVCTSRFIGCEEYLDPRYASKYIQPCPSSCIIFRNPNDHNVITRDCAASWPQIHAKSGLHKLLDSDAFFCQESLCNGISFDFIMGIFHNQLPAVITFPPVQTMDERSTTIINDPIPTTTPSIPSPSRTTMNIEDDDTIWEDPDLDAVVVESTTTTIPTPSTTLSPTPTEYIDDTEEEYDQSTTVPPEFIERFDFTEKIPSSSTISGGMAVAEDDSQLNWWDLNDFSLPSVTEPINSPTTTINSPPSSPSTIEQSTREEDDWVLFNTSVVSSMMPFEHASDLNPEVDLDMNDYFLPAWMSTTPTVDSINKPTPPFVPYYFTDYKSEDDLFDFMNPMSTLAMPPFSWMLHLANQNKTKPIARQNTSTKAKKMKKNNNKKRLDLKKTLTHDHDQFYEYCKKKPCQHGGRLNSDCLCICLPAFSGNNCERIDCQQEPAHLCDFVLEHECQNDHIRYLCPKFCQMNICSSTQTS